MPYAIDTDYPYYKKQDLWQCPGENISAFNHSIVHSCHTVSVT
ncbi:hypothetical protein A35_0032 (plasmid) [Coxiella burnetii 'MSU Goat Q177']|nr:hypothetical protein A35_0032 [Coxiella burnetii 'MSU Goat Q177']